MLQRPLEELSSHLYGIASLREGLITTTGDPAMDRALGRELVRLSTIFGEQPGFGFIDDGRAPNAYASPQIQIETWGTVMFGQTMFHDLRDRYTDQGMAVLAVCAHEFRHIAQFRSGVRDRLLRGQRTVKRMELHADLLSGYFLGYRKRIDGDISVWAAGHALYSIGDYAFNNPNHHGTPNERVAAAEYGYKLAHDERVSPAEELAPKDEHRELWVVPVVMPHQHRSRMGAFLANPQCAQLAEREPGSTQFRAISVTDPAKGCPTARRGARPCASCSWRRSSRRTKSSFRGVPALGRRGLELGLEARLGTDHASLVLGVQIGNPGSPPGDDFCSYVVMLGHVSLALRSGAFFERTTPSSV